MDEGAVTREPTELVVVPLDAIGAAPAVDGADDVQVARVARGARARPGTRRVALVAMALVAAAAVVVAALSRDGGSVAAPPPRWFALATAPEGRSVMVVDNETAFGGSHVSYFGDPGADDPFATRDLAVMVQDAPGASLAASSREFADPVEVRGTRGGFVELAPGRTDLPVTLVFVEGDRSVQAMSRHLGRDGLVEVVERLAFGADGSVSITGDARGLRPLGAARSTGPTLPIATDASARLVQYMSTRPTSGASNGFLTVASFAGDADSLRLARFWGARPTRVRGRDAVSFGIDEPDGGSGGSYRMLLWQLADRTVVAVAGNGTAEEVAAFADQVRELDAAAWRALGGSPDGGTATTAARLPEPSRGPQGTVPPAPLPDGSALPAVLVGADGTLDGIAWAFEDRDRVGCLVVRERRSCIAMEDDPASGTGRFVAVTSADRRVVAFVTTTDVVQVEVEPAGRPTLRFGGSQTLANGRRVFVSVTPAASASAGPVWAPVTVRTADGRATVADQDVAVLGG